MTATGVVRSFNDAKGWGFIACDLVEGDVFLHVKDCQDGRPNAGDQVSFGLEEDGVRAGQLKASCVTGCSGAMLEEEGNAARRALLFGDAQGFKGGKGGFKGGKGGFEGGFKGGKGAGAFPATTHVATFTAGQEAGPTADGKFAATCKSFNDAKGWGFIDYQGADVFLHVKDCLDGRPQAGDYLTFDVEESGQQAGQLKASNVTGCSGVMEEQDKGKGKKQQQQQQRQQLPQGGVTADGKFHACCKSFNDLKGWGFIDFQGADVFLHVKDCLDGRPQAGDMLTFDCEETDRGSAGQLKASNVMGCSGSVEKGMGKGGPMMPQTMGGAQNNVMLGALGGAYGLASKFPALPPTVYPGAVSAGQLGDGAPKSSKVHVSDGRAEGIVKTYNDGKGWGFIDFQGSDVFLHVKDCLDGRPQAGDRVNFDTEQDGARGGQLKALNVTGCSGEGKGSAGKGGGAFGPGKGGGGLACGAAGPYGGGFGKMTCY